MTQNSKFYSSLLLALLPLISTSSVTFVADEAESNNNIADDANAASAQDRRISVQDIISEIKAREEDSQIRIPLIKRISPDIALSLSGDIHDFVPSSATEAYGFPTNVSIKSDVARSLKENAKVGIAGGINFRVTEDSIFALRAIGTVTSPNTLALHVPKRDLGWIKGWGKDGSALDKSVATTVDSKLIYALGVEGDYRFRFFRGILPRKLSFLVGAGCDYKVWPSNNLSTEVLSSKAFKTSNLKGSVKFGLSVDLPAHLSFSIGVLADVCRQPNFGLKDTKIADAKEIDSLVSRISNSAFAFNNLRIGLQLGFSSRSLLQS